MKVGMYAVVPLLATLLSTHVQSNTPLDIMYSSMNLPHIVVFKKHKTAVTVLIVSTETDFNLEEIEFMAGLLLL